jgi:hypothetical protein
MQSNTCLFTAFSMLSLFNITASTRYYGSFQYAVTESSLNACNDTDWGVCSWPWQYFAPGKDDTSLSVTSNGCIPVKNTLDWRAVVFFACEVIQLFSVMYWVVKFDFRRETGEGGGSDRSFHFSYHPTVLLQTGFQIPQFFRWPPKHTPRHSHTHDMPRWSRFRTALYLTWSV